MKSLPQMHEVEAQNVEASHEIDKHRSRELPYRYICIYNTRSTRRDEKKPTWDAVADATPPCSVEAKPHT